MKKILNLLVASAMMFATFGLAGCGDDPNEKPGDDGLVNAGTHYAIYYNGDRIEPGATITYSADEQDIQLDFVSITLLLENLTSSVLETTQEVKLLEGPEDMKNVEICGGGSCPWDGRPYMLDPGINASKPLSIELFPSAHAKNASALYRVAVAQPGMENATYIYLRINL